MTDKTKPRTILTVKKPSSLTPRHQHEAFIRKHNALVAWELKKKRAKAVEMAQGRK